MQAPGIQPENHFQLTASRQHDPPGRQTPHQRPGRVVVDQRWAHWLLGLHPFWLAILPASTVGYHVSLVTQPTVRDQGRGLSLCLPSHTYPVDSAWLLRQV